MAIDLSRFIATFFDEAREHLETIEATVMSLDAPGGDPERLNAMFRAAHSIKGGSGTFGFTQLTEATHEMETLFDRLRRGQARADRPLVRLLLDACDAFKAHLARLKAGDRTADGAMDAVRERLGGYRAAVEAPADVPAGGSQAAPPVARLAPGMRVYRAGPRDRARSAAIVPVLRSTLEGFGDLMGEEAEGIRIASARSRDELAEALAFALDPADFTLEPEAETPVAERYGLFAAEQPAAAPEAGASPAPPGSPSEKYGFFDAPGDRLAEAKEHNRRQGDQSSIRVSVEKIDRIVNLVGELVIAQAMLQQAASKGAAGEDEGLAHSLSTLDRNTRELQQAVMSIRMMPMEFVFSRFPRQVYDLSTRMGKQVQLRTQGHETELDKELIELLVDPLTHVVRNAIDHGIEPPEERVRSGKPAQGTVGMRATHRGGSVIIEVTDDGRGLDRERILAKARELGMPVDDDMADADVWNLVFEAGFTTASRVTELSGRGVGMDVVRRNIAALGGSVRVASAKGEGTTITIQLPLTLAVLDGMIVTVGAEHYIVPLEFVAEAFKPAAGDVKTVVNQASLVAVRGEHLPLVRLEEIVELPPTQAPRPDPLCLVVEVDDRRAALLVDALVGQQQLVVKSLESNLHHVAGISGATILGDGRVALILDVASITRRSATRARVAA